VHCADPLSMNGMSMGKDGLGALDSEATDEVRTP
jgi:hypothetical protein